MKSIIISSNCSGGGKTTFTLGLMKVLKNRNFDVQGYKVGPDYIDTAYHKEVTKKASRNLDTFLMGKEGMIKSFLKGNGDIGIIEGVMGLYDGLGISERASTYEVSKFLEDMPIILVLSPKGQSASLCAEINGFKNYRNANIVGVILNAVSEKYYNLLKCAIEENCNIEVWGYVPKNSNIALNSRHLGLVQSMEITNLNEKINIISKLIEENVNVDAIINKMKEFQAEKDKCIVENFKIPANNKKELRIGVALDKAFNFYYKDNLELLEQFGEVIYFSPLKDKALPANLDFLYIGGGYPEVFKEELEKNISMRSSIKEALENGLRCYAECGGLMYLTKSIDGAEMIGFFEGDSIMTSKLQNFGYCNVKVNGKIFGENFKEEFLEINAHEFHKSKVNINAEKVYEVKKNLYSGEVLKWECGYFKKNTLGAYPHINFLGNEKFLKVLLNVI